MHPRGRVLAPSPPADLGVVGLTWALLFRAEVLGFSVSLLGAIWVVAPCAREAGGVWLSVHKAGGVRITSAPPTAPSEMVWPGVAPAAADSTTGWFSVAPPVAASEGVRSAGASPVGASGVCS